MKIKLAFGLYWIVELVDAGVEDLCAHIRNEDGSKHHTYRCTFATMDEMAKAWGISVGAKHVTYIDVTPTY